ncbi:MAG: cation-transporting P-type ATPase [Bacillota bacterium]
MEESNWHILDIQAVARALDTNIEDGLTPGEAAARHARYGPNLLPQARGETPWLIFLRQFKSVIVLLLAAATAVSMVMGDLLEAVAIAVVIFLNALFGFFIEFRAERAVAALKRVITRTAKVVRGGNLREIPAAEVVPGDLLVLEEGDRVVADARVVDADNLATVEAALTGESQPVAKEARPLTDPRLPLADRINMVYAGTSVARGSGLAVVTATGRATEIGRIAGLLQQTADEETPLEKRLTALGNRLVVVALVVALAVTVTGLVAGHPFWEILTTGIALAVAAVPEGLPAVVTISLATGVWRMARQNAIVRRLPAVETLGSTTVICTDKTGTLTENRMRLVAVWTAGETIAPGREWSEVPLGTPLRRLLEAGVLASRASLQRDAEGNWDVVGDATEGALILAGMQAGFTREGAEGQGYARLDEIPFSSETRRMAVYYRRPDGSMAVYAKGAAPVILEASGTWQQKEGEKPLDERARQEIHRAEEEFAARGLRVLAVAAKPVSTAGEEAFRDLTFLGLVGIADPPRAEVPEAIAEARRAGIRTIMITGDHPVTARAVALQIGLADPQARVVTGSELAAMSRAELAAQAGEVAVFARVAPEQKLDIVEALKDRHEIVAMTGDGVNDAPALKRADVGIAMGREGTAVARETADMVLADDNFATIVRAVKQGRVIFDNIQKFIHYLFSCNLSEIILIFLALLLGMPVPLLVLQILWLNLVTDVFPALALGWEPPEGNVMRRPPRDPRQGLLTPGLQLAVLVEGVLLAAGPLAAYGYVLTTAGNVALARTIVFLSLSFAQLLHVLNVRRLEKFGFDRTLLANRRLIGALVLTTGLQFLAVYLPALNAVLRTVPPGGAEWFIAVLATVAPVGLAQAVLRFVRRA